MTRRLRLQLLLGVGLLGAVLGAACTGNIGDPPGTTGEIKAPLCTGLEPGKSPIRRMTRFEYNNTVRDLLGDTTEPANTFPPEEEAMGFNNQATALQVTELLAQQLMEASEGIASRATKDLAKLVPCDPDLFSDRAKLSNDGLARDACVHKFIHAFGKRAFRRPITGEDDARFFKLFTWGRETYGAVTGLELVIQAILQSPRFLYRVEFGMPDPVEKDVVPLDDYEVASRLSYLLWSTMPDDELFAAAEAGQLRTKEQIAAQARRMLDDPKAHSAVENFHSQWLGLSKLDGITKDAAIYPDYDPDLRPLWKQETLAFLNQVIFEDQGDVAAMFTAPYSMMNAELAAFYGISGPTGEAFERVELDPSQRAGFLTHASLLAINANPNQSSPVHRGKFVRERLLCQTLPPPPNNIVIVPPDVDPKATTRQKFSEHSTNPACSVCHKLMDPVGFGFEHYDAIGRWRDKDHGLTIDATGEIVGARDVSGDFDGAVELAGKLAESEQVRQCVATQWFRYGYGRAEQKDDQCAMQQLQLAFEGAGFSVKELLVALTQTDAFRYRHAVAAGK